MITAEEFFRNKIKEQTPNREVVALSLELITAEQGMRWAHEFKELQQTAVMRWVACLERLPDSSGSYLCFWENCYVGMLFFNSNKEWCEMWQQKKHKPSHWMPLPFPPCT